MPNPSDLFLSPDLTEADARAYLGSLGFRDPAAVDEHLQGMANDMVIREALGRLAADLLPSILESPDPDAAVVVTPPAVVVEAAVLPPYLPQAASTRPTVPRPASWSSRRRGRRRAGAWRAAIVSRSNSRPRSCRSSSRWGVVMGVSMLRPPAERPEISLGGS